ncbi:hypothetical protein BN946_scf185004.g2 [Trametes cinnabarina]|uniref:Uncharacterized protein n=1 Tax=Pycnoporus cinnabarinus TaxID=5643 RepID=A0A060SK44_PYCCI|nr:hypothetical protein BN946_scf185004.g2 [Trametes cinnabarina]
MQSTASAEPRALAKTHYLMIMGQHAADAAVLQTENPVQQPSNINFINTITSTMGKPISLLGKHSCKKGSDAGKKHKKHAMSSATAPASESSVQNPMPSPSGSATPSIPPGSPASPLVTLYPPATTSVTPIAAMSVISMSMRAMGTTTAPMVPAPVLPRRWHSVYVTTVAPVAFDFH